MIVKLLILERKKFIYDIFSHSTFQSKGSWKPMKRTMEKRI